MGVVCVNCRVVERPEKDRGKSKSWNKHGMCSKCFLSKYYDLEVKKVSNVVYDRSLTFKFRRDKLAVANRQSILRSHGSKTVKLLEQYIKENL